MQFRGFKAAAAAIVMLGWSVATASGGFPDCNDNGIDDTVETATTFTEMIAADGPYPSLLADIDSDGDLDLVGASGSVVSSGPAIPLSWRENLDGLGTFGPAQLIDDVRGEVVVGDFDRDGDPDLAFRAQGEYCASPLYIAVYENLGFGTFAPPQVVWDFVSCGGCPSDWYGDRSWGVADRDSDGDLDIFALVLVCSAGRVLTVLNDGTGNGWSPTSQSGSGLFDSAVADVDSDGYNDLVSSHFINLLVWIEGWPSGTEHWLSSAGQLGELQLDDFDGDGDPDIVGIQSNEIAVYENASGLGNYVQTEVVAPIDDLSKARISAGADLDGNGYPDLLWSDGLTVSWRPNVHGSFGEPELIEENVGELFVSSIDFGDIDGDGDTDVLVPQARSSDCSCCSSGGCSSPACRAIVCASALECCDGWSAACAAQAAQDCCCCNAEDCDNRVAWYRNDGNDCNGNRVPDECEPDCNGNGIVDACDVRDGSSIDCDGNGTPDECDTGCSGDLCDHDGDGCQDGVDDDPTNPVVCGDTDADGCDDCSSGTFDPEHDGANGDSDGVCDPTDCDPLNNEVWSVSGPVAGLSLEQQGATTTLGWSRPEAPGGTEPRYDVLRSSSASDFLSATTLCLESDDGDEGAADTETPGSGDLFHYLVRAENDCPGGGGSMGPDSSGVPRAGLSCVPVPSGTGPVLNEVNQDPGPNDPGEYVEVFNPSAMPVDLSDLALIFVNSIGNETERVSLAPAGVLPPGGYVVVAAPSVVVDPGAGLILFPGETHNIPSGGGGIALFDLGATALLDALSYGAEITDAIFDGVPGTWNLVEGEPTPWTDNYSEDGSMVRYPDGLDTDNAASDWGVSGPPTGSPTPGSANSIPW